MKKVLKYTVSILLLWFVAHCTYIVIDGLFDEDTTADVAVILGSTVNEDGSLSPRLKARLDKGYELYRTGKVNKLMVSGGTGKNSAKKPAIFISGAGTPIIGLWRSISRSTRDAISR